MTFDTSLGEYQAAVHRRLAEWQTADAPGRLWAADHTLWTTEPEPEIDNRLGWLRLPGTMRNAVPGILEFAEAVRTEGITEVVLLGMGGSSLAPEVYERTFGSRSGYPRLTVLDSTHPAAVEAVGEAIDPGSTLFIVASKSGTTIEPLSLLEYFWERVGEPGGDPGRSFVAITDAGSHLEDLARDRRFRHTFTAIPDIGGRYSALTHFGLVPAALIGADITAMLDEAAAMAEAARRGDAGFPLGAALGELALSGRDKATFAVSESLASFPAWAEQLIAESTGKDGKAILPVADEEIGSPDTYGSDRVFISLALTTDDTAALDKGLGALENAGHPVIRISIDRPGALAAEMYRAEIAVAMAGSVLGIHPFNQPDVQRAKILAKQAMAGELQAGDIPEVPADGPGLAGSLTGFLGETADHGYLAIQAFIAPTGKAETALQRIRHLARTKTGAATTLGFGPRFLHSTGQLHKGGPDTGIFLQIVDHAAPRLDIPGAGYTFGDLIAGQADGDHQALAAAGRRVLRICLGDDVAGGLAAIEEVLRG
jgi:transaldolase/glucose-6-phosphate isomerase